MTCPECGAVLEDDEVCSECDVAGEELEDADPTEPEDGDITTQDNRTFYQYGKCVVEVSRREYDEDPDCGRRAVAAFMSESKFWPNVWYCSDHGNWSIITGDVWASAAE